MSEFVELIKVVIANPSSSIVVFAICGFLIFKVKDLLQIFLDIKDLNKKRLMQKFEETYIFHEKNFLSSELKINYERLCEEAQIKALIGCPYCSKEMAQYILSRKHITSAIRSYHRIKDEIEINDGSISPRIVMRGWRIKLNKYIGYFIYFFLSFLSLMPMILAVTGGFSTVQDVFNGQYFLVAILIFIVLFIPALLILNQSLKPEFTKDFCELETQATDEAECKSETIEVTEKVA